MARRWIQTLGVIGGLVCLAFWPAQLVMADQKPPAIVTSIKPVHALVAAVMGNLGAPQLLLEAPASAHHFTLKPSQARSLQTADMVFWIGPAMERPLTKALAALAPQAKSVPLIDSAGLTLLAFDDGGLSAEQHDHKTPAGHDDHESHDEHKGHDEHAINPHIWLDPQNARIMLDVIASQLGKVDPVNAKAYAANAAALGQTIALLQADIARQLAPVATGKFLVLHDAHIYFERRFGLRAYAAITTEPDVMPTAARIKTLRGELAKHQIDCIFGEPFLGQNAIRLIAEDRQVRIRQLDPLGSQLPAGASLYPDLLKLYAAALESCLEKS